MMIWNRKEVFVGFSMQKFNECRQILGANNIHYSHRLVNNDNSSRRARTGTFGEKVEYSITYYIYVHKAEYDRACAVLRNSNFNQSLS